jgi:CII-binding regulator of phage lambda lysogenization HflD
MINGDAILAAILSLREATELGFKRLEERMTKLEFRLDKLELRMDKLGARVDALETHLAHFEAKVYVHFDALDLRLAAVEAR